MTIQLAAFEDQSSPSPYAMVVIPIVGIKPSLQFVGSKQLYVGGIQRQSHRYRTMYEIQSIPYLTNSIDGITTETVYGAVKGIIAAPFLKLQTNDDTFPRWSDEENFPSTAFVDGIWVVIESIMVESMWESGKEQLTILLQSQEVQE
jgi:methyl coenzyme M reductase subunit C-like uncharacterized protein (methanogenesis marker protein 7)